MKGVKFNRSSCLLLLVALVSLFVLADGKGGGAGVRLNAGHNTRVTYPSEVRRKYYKYYIAYFSPSGRYYASTAHQSSRTRTICRNEEPYFGNETVLGYFPCPMENDPDDFNYCCGDEGYQYCCKRIDSKSFQLMLGLSIAAVLGVLIGILICVYIGCKSKRKETQRKQTGQKQMLQMGIPRYETLKTSNITATQREDGHNIMVKFASNGRYYQKFWQELQATYPNIAWRFSDGQRKKEGKLAFQDGSCVTVYLTDDVEGRPAMCVLTGKFAVDWMETVFEDIREKIPDDPAACSCFSQRKTHPIRNQKSKTETEMKTRQTEQQNQDQMGRSGQPEY